MHAEFVIQIFLRNVMFGICKISRKSCTLKYQAHFFRSIKRTVITDERKIAKRTKL